MTGFFNFMNSFDFKTRVVSIRSREEYLTKSAKGWTLNLVNFNSIIPVAEWLGSWLQSFVPKSETLLLYRS